MGEFQSASRDHAGPLRICVTGAECTGKTTLALELAHHYAAPIVREFSREYFTEKHARGDASVHMSDVVKVTAEQARIEDLAAKWTGPLIVCDTDVLTTAIWCEAYLHEKCANFVAVSADRAANGNGIDLYLLCAPDVPFIPDALRTSSEHRKRMHELFRTRLAESESPFVEVGGSIRQRVAAAIDAIELLRAERIPASSRARVR